jgi:hypothetical protein
MTAHVSKVGDLDETWYANETLRKVGYEPT